KLRRCGVPEAWRGFGGAEPGEADRTAVNALLDALSQRRPVKEVPPDKADAEYGFDKPAAAVSVWAQGVPTDQAHVAKMPPPEPKITAEPTVAIKFGKTDKELVFVKRSEGKESRVLAVPATLLAKVARAPLSFASKTLPSFLIVDPVKLEITRDG